MHNIYDNLHLDIQNLHSYIRKQMDAVNNRINRCITKS